MSDQHRVDEVAGKRPSEGISDVQDRPEGSLQNNGSKLRQENEEKSGNGDWQGTRQFR